jgi:hypothetical protein
MVSKKKKNVKTLKKAMKNSSAKKTSGAKKPKKIVGNARTKAKNTKAKKPEKKIKAIKSTKIKKAVSIKKSPKKVEKKLKSRNVTVSKKPTQARAVKKQLMPAKLAEKKQIIPAQRKKKMIEKDDYDARNDFAVSELAHPAPSKKPTTLLGALEFMPYQPKADEAYMSDPQREHFRKICWHGNNSLCKMSFNAGHLKEEAVFMRTLLIEPQRRFI